MARKIDYTDGVKRIPACVVEDHSLVNKDMTAERAPNALLQRPPCPVGESQCAIIDELLQLREMVITDPLTGLYNVRYFREILAQELERTERTLISTSLMMIDLDHFKRINDTYGHEAGNAVLQQTARLIQASTRKLDIQCRYGGEEFVVILPSTERMMALQVAERLCDNIAQTPVLVDGHELSVTASVGLAFHSTEKFHTSSSLIKEVDQYLYEAKQNGRNQVRYAQADEHISAVNADEKDLLHALFGKAPQVSREQILPPSDYNDDFVDDSDDWG